MLWLVSLEIASGLIASFAAGSVPGYTQPREANQHPVRFFQRKSADSGLHMYAVTAQPP